MKSDKYSTKIRIAIVITVLLIAPTALAIGLYLHNSFTDKEENTIQTTTTILNE